MSQRFLDRSQVVGYDFEKKMLIVTISDKMAQKMIADGWDVPHEKQLGYFIQVSLTEGEGDSQHPPADPRSSSPGSPASG